MPRMKLEGVKQFGAALRRIERETGKAFKKASAWAAERVLEEIEPLVPLETGALRASAIWVQEGKGWDTVTWIGYGAEVSGFDRAGKPKEPEEYAVRQHEEYPLKHTPGTIIEYLLVGLDMQETLISEIMFDYMRFTVK